MSLNENIERLRKQKQMSQPELAEKAGVSKGYIYMLEAGEMTNPSLDVLMKIAAALDSTIAELVGEPTVVARPVAQEIPDTLRQFIKERKKAGEPLSEDDLISLANTQFRGQRPQTVDDWRYVYEFFKRTLGKRP